MNSVTGRVAPAFTAVKDVLHHHLENGDDLGAGVSVFVDGELVVELRGGWQDRQKTTPFDQTLCCIYSSGKAVVAALIMAEVAQGRLDYDAPVADFWPEFAAMGKGALTVAQLLSHQSGLAAFMEPIDPAEWIDWEAICTRLAAATPKWPPGTANGYHPQTVGFMAGELIRRVSGKTVGAHLRDLGIDIHCGMSPALQERVGRMIKPPAAPDLGPLTDLKKAAFLQKWSSPAGVGPQAYLAAEIPASNMHATATDLARIMHAFVDGRLGDVKIPTEVRAHALREQIEGDDLVLPFHLSWAAGLMRNVSHHLGPSSTAAGHYGFGGSCVLADPEKNLSLAYIPNKMSPALVGDPRALALINAVYGCLEE